MPPTWRQPGAGKTGGGQGGSLEGLGGTYASGYSGDSSQGYQAFVESNFTSTSTSSNSKLFKSNLNLSSEAEKMYIK